MKMILEQNTSYNELEAYFNYLEQRDFGYDGEIKDLSTPSEIPFSYFHYRSSNSLIHLSRRVDTGKNPEYSIHLKLCENDQITTFIMFEVKKITHSVTKLIHYRFSPIYQKKIILKNNKVDRVLEQRRLSDNEFTELYLPLAKSIMENSKDAFKDKVNAL